VAKILTCCFLLILVTVAAEAADPTVVLYLPLDEGQGSKATDLSGYGNHGVLEEGPEWITGKFNRALEFDEGSRVYIPASDSLHGDIFKGDFTLLAWIMPAVAGDTWQHVWRSVDGDDGTQCTLFFNTGGFLSWRGRVADAWGERCATPDGLITGDDWTHIAVVSDGIDYKMYIDGEEAASVAYEEMDGDIVDFYLGFDGREWDEQVKNAMSGIDLSVQPAGKLAGTWGALKH